MTKRIEELDKNLQVGPPEAEADLTWLPGTDPRFTVRGLPWFDENDGAYYRLPKRVVTATTPLRAPCPGSPKDGPMITSTSLMSRAGSVHGARPS